MKDIFSIKNSSLNFKPVFYKFSFSVLYEQNSLINYSQNHFLSPNLRKGCHHLKMVIFNELCKNSE